MLSTWVPSSGVWRTSRNFSGVSAPFAQMSSPSLLKITRRRRCTFCRRAVPIPVCFFTARESCDADGNPVARLPAARPMRTCRRVGNCDSGVSGIPDSFCTAEGRFGSALSQVTPCSWPKCFSSVKDRPVFRVARGSGWSHCITGQGGMLAATGVVVYWRTIQAAFR